MLKSIPPFSRGLIFALIALSLLSLVSPGIFGPLFVLSSDSVFNDFYVWTLATYPFVSSMWGAIVTGFVIWSFGSELEQIIHTPRFAMMVSLVILLCGVTFILIEPNGSMYGPEVLGVFLVTAFAYMWPEREVSIMGLFWVRSWVIAVIYFVIAFIPKVGTRFDFSAHQILAPIFGAVAALILFHFSYGQHRLPSFGNKKSPSKRSEPKDDASDPRAINRRIDEILDKIASKGMNSLSQEEKDFLLKHSK
jgi:membrane associated rhomboid family serine protease